MGPLWACCAGSCGPMKSEGGALMSRLYGVGHCHSFPWAPVFYSEIMRRLILLTRHLLERNCDRLEEIVLECNGDIFASVGGSLGVLRLECETISLCKKAFVWERAWFCYAM